MLERSAHEETRSRRGRLKIFFGAVPGVGKTFAMLEAARLRRQQGADVVIGWVETHGRKETAALADGLERIAPRAVAYRGVVLEEFDLDAALARHPALILVDELAHTNAPGSRHARRWQDVVELLDAGLEVYTTLNVQHVESLNDLVGGITGIAVRETVPDSLIDQAHEIELIDIPPDDVLRRLAEGKVYVPAQAERATQNFFKKGNLIALRELALRRTAERVDAQATEWKREHGIDESWRTTERLLVAVDHSAQSADLIRAARRMASRLRAPWIVLTVEDPTFTRLPEEDRERVSEHLALAQRLGAATLAVRGEDAAEEILAVARERNVSRILVNRPRTPRWVRVLRGSVLDDLVAGSKEVEVLVTPGEPEDGPRLRPKPITRASRTSEIAWGVLPLVVCTLVCLLTRDLFTLADQSMIYVLGVLVASSRLSRVPALVAAVMSILLLDFFFVPPLYEFAVEHVRYSVTFGVMLLVAVSVSRRTVRMREQADSARERERRTAALFSLSRELGVESEQVPIAESAIGHVRSLFDCDAAVFLRDESEGLVRIAGDTTGVLSSDREKGVARWVLDHGRSAGSGTDTLPASNALFLPLIGARRTLGVFGVALGSRSEDLTPSQVQILDTFVAQTALALERVLLSEEAARARIAAETEGLRSSLLSSVSHDLRTPLASITGSAQVMLSDGERLSADAKRELLETIREEGERLSRLVGNLLDLTRLESGAIQVKKEWCPVDEIVHSAVGRLSKRLGQREVRIDLPEDLVLLPADPVLLEQVLVNLLENALKYSAVGPIEVKARALPGSVEIEVSDRGRGIPPGEQQRIFEKFYRIGESASSEGAGLGLAVAYGIVKAHGGTISAENRAGGGATFRFRVPVEGEPTSEAEFEGRVS